MIGQHGLKNSEEAKYIARHEVLCTLDDVVKQSAKLLKPGRPLLYGTPSVSSGGDHGDHDKV